MVQHGVISEKTIGKDLEGSCSDRFWLRAWPLGNLADLLIFSSRFQRKVFPRKVMDTMLMCNTLECDVWCKDLQCRN